MYSVQVAVENISCTLWLWRFEVCTLYLYSVHVQCAFVVYGLHLTVCKLQWGILIMAVYSQNIAMIDVYCTVLL